MVFFFLLLNFLLHSFALHVKFNKIFIFFLRPDLTMWDSSLIKWVPLWIGVIVQVADAQVTCPWDNPELELWSDGATWPSGEIPQFNDSVVIPHGNLFHLVCSWF